MTERVDGILNIDKPYGITSMEVVRRLKRASRVKRVGHGGTLDPLATGVVAICFGQATRVMEYLVAGMKEYEGVVELGKTTDTYDALGQITGEGDCSHVDLENLGKALESFRGVGEQVPPMYSALKRGGKRLYELARAGIQVDLEPRKVEVFSMELVDWSSPLVTVRVCCGRGFYMRSLAHDLGQALGCGGHLKNLVRLRSGPFEIADALPLTDAERKIEDGSWGDEMHASDVVLQDMPVILAGKRMKEMIGHGRPLTIDSQNSSSTLGGKCRVYSVGGSFIGILAYDAVTRQWRPEKVFSSA